MVGGAARYDLVIAGLGPVGAVAANLAGAAGLSTLVVERGTTPYDKPRAIVFDAEIMRIFAAIGLADILATVTRPLHGSVYLGADRAPIRTFTAHPRPHERTWHPSNLFYQPQLEAILRDGLVRFPQVEIVHETAVTSVEDHGDRVTVVTDRGSVDAGYLLACDGASSAVRKSLGIALDDIGFEERWLVVDTDVTGPMRWPDGYDIPPHVRDGRYSLMVCDPVRPATLIPGRGSHRRWEYMLLPDESDQDVVTDAWLRARLATWVDPADVAIVRAAVYRFRALVAERWRIGRTFLLGDAAHQTPPFFGQGMCHGIRDAAQLMWRLEMVSRSTADPGVLDSYQAEREPHVRAIIAASVAAGAEVCKVDPDDAAERDARFRALERERAGRVAMTDVVPPIRDGVIDPATGGERLPDFILADGTRLDTALGSGFALLSRTPIEIARDRVPGHTIVVEHDADGRMADWFAARSAGWALVRPDRYVFATGTGVDELRRSLALLAGMMFDDATLEITTP